MSETIFGSTHDLAKRVYSEELFRDSVKETFFGSKLMSTTGDKPVHVKTDLEKGKGDKIRIPLRMRLTGPATLGDATLKGNESDLDFYNMDIELEQHRKAVKDSGAMSRKRPAFDPEDEMKTALKEWMSEYVDQMCFDALGIGSGATSDPSKVFYRDSSGNGNAGSAATAKAALDATNSKITPALVRLIRSWAVTGGNRQYIPLRQLKSQGMGNYMMLVHPTVGFDMKNDPTYESYIREAEVRGKENPLFTGALAVIDGVAIFEHENCAVASDGGAGSVTWSKAIFMGQQALCWAWGKRPEMVEETDDYGNKLLKSIGIIAAAKKSKFNSLDYGSVGVWLACSNVHAL